MSLPIASIICLLLAGSASAYVCSDFTGVQCSASAVFAMFRSGYLLAETNYAPLFPRPPYIKRIRGNGDGFVRLFIDTHSGQDTCSIGLTGQQDHYVIRCDSQPNAVYALRIAYADYHHCYVAQSDNHRFGCTLVVRENSSPRTLGRCLRGLARVCPGPLFTTWNQQCVRGCSYRSSYLPWGSGQQTQQQQHKLLA
ncbi:uncharacterized protein LOC144146870 [Haemaphysalis longicornis]